MTVTIRTTHLWKFLRRFFQKSMVACEYCRYFECDWRHPMLNFCEIQHPKGNRQRPAYRRFWFFLRQFCQKERKRFSHINKKGSYLCKVSPLCFNIEVIISVLFCASRRKKEPKNGDKEFRLCGGDEGFAQIEFWMLTSQKISIRWRHWHSKNR